MVAAVCAWHERHAAAAAAIERAGGHLIVPAHALAETYAVLTRLPAPHRLSPADAWSLVKANFIDQSTVAPLDAAGHEAVLARLAQTGIAGGRTYDALIAAAALNGGAKALLTLNPRHFDAAAGLDIAAI
jgi:predicted nucleic acid-binding protein